AVAGYAVDAVLRILCGGDDGQRVAAAGGRVVVECGQAAVAAAAAHHETVGRAGAGTAEHQVRAVGAGDDGGADAGVVAGLVDGVANLGQRVVALGEIQAHRLAIHREGERAGAHLGAAVGERAGGGLECGGQLGDVDLVAAADRGAGGRGTEDVGVGGGHR